VATKERIPELALIAGVVVDTDVLSFGFKGDTRASLYERHLDGKLLVISFMTRAELHQWSLLKNWGERRKRELAVFLEQYVIVHSDADLCLAWAKITSGAIRRGQAIGPADAWIAATAVVYESPLITHNKRDYEGIPGLDVVSEA
jgi:tRNA(fMet)-specific endonuclease VapC